MTSKKPPIDLKKLNLNNKALVIIFGVPVLALFAYFQFFADAPQKGEEKEVYVGTPDLHLNDTSKTIVKKSEVYKQERREQLKKSRLTKPDFYQFQQEEEEPEIVYEEPEVVEQRVSEPQTRPVKVIKEVVYRDAPKPETSPAPAPKPEPSNRPLIRRRSGGEAFNTFEDVKTGSAQTQGNDGFVSAVVHGEHKVRSGEMITMRLTEETIIDNTIVPKGTMLYGICQVSKERLEISISSISMPQKYIATKLSVYDKNGMKGLYIPGGVNQEIARDAISDGINQGGGLTVNVPVVGTISTGAIKKKAGDPIVTIPNNYNIKIK